MTIQTASTSPRAADMVIARKDAVAANLPNGGATHPAAPAASTRPNANLTGQRIQHTDTPTTCTSARYADMGIGREHAVATSLVDSTGVDTRFVAGGGPGVSGVVGRVLAGAMRRGEVLTDARLVGGGLLEGYGPGVAAVPVRMADAGAVRLLKPGDRIDVLATAEADEAADVPRAGEGTSQPGGSTARGGRDEADGGVARAVGVVAVARSVPVIVVPRGTSGEDGALVVVAASAAQAAEIAASSGRSRLSFTIVGS
jgi:hypothetical protein